MKIYGLLGRDISYSFSGDYFTQKFKEEGIGDAEYRNFDLKEITGVEELFRMPNLEGFNVTIPYKEAIIPYLDRVEGAAKEIGAVNCVKITENEKVGFNTDIYGFESSLRPLLNPTYKSALILGTGGASKAAAYVLRQLEISYKKVSRRGKLTYVDVNEKMMKNHLLIINCTPLGTQPNIDEAPAIPYRFLTSDHLLFDMIYNPSETKFLRLGKARGSRIKNGLEMLVLQAEKSREIWKALL